MHMYNYVHMSVQFDYTNHYPILHNFQCVKLLWVSLTEINDIIDLALHSAKYIHDHALMAGQQLTVKLVSVSTTNEH